MYISRRPNGLYLLTANPPVVANGDVYAEPGDPIAWNNMCEWSRTHIFHVEELRPLQTVGVTLHGRQIGEPFMAADKKDRTYGIQVGGCALIKDGTHAGSFAAVCQYGDMDYKNVQQFWHAITTDQRMLAATAAYAAAVTPVLVELGDQYGLKTGRLTQADIAEL